MEPIESNSLVTFSVCFIILLMALFVIGYFLVQWGIKQLKNDRINDRINEAEYKIMYSNIQKHISEWPTDLGIYYKIKQEIWRLENLKWKNKEKTAGINTELCSGRFFDIALSEAKKRVSKK